MKRPYSEFQVRVDKAVLPTWPQGGVSKIDTGFGIKIPKGTVIHVGEISSQGGRSCRAICIETGGYMAAYDAIIKKKIEDIIELINGYNYRWSTIFNNYLKELSNNIELSEFARDILKLYQGGMGSFSDLVLQKNGKMPFEDNERLDKLRNELYKICEELL